mgnify:CR=1 FL=1
MVPEYIKNFQEWCATLDKQSRFCLLVSADPDALSSAMAMRKLLRKYVQGITICSVNNVTRPDNLAMIRYLRIPLERFSKENMEKFTHFGVIDSQPTHNKQFADCTFSLVIDHHPPTDFAASLTEVNYTYIRKSLGATATIMTKFLRELHDRPGPLLATALLYGIRSDTGAFERSGGEEDLKAYHWLYKYANAMLLRRICRSEYLREWLPLFSRAFRSLQDCPGGGVHVSLKEVKHADLLVSIADFFTKIHGLRWVAVSGVVDRTVVVIFRGDGARDMGQMAVQCFAKLGEGGGHKNLARAEFPVSMVPEGMNSVDFVRKQLQSFRQVRTKEKSTDKA